MAHYNPGYLYLYMSYSCRYLPREQARMLPHEHLFGLAMWSLSRIEPIRARIGREWFTGHALRFAALPLGLKYRAIIALVRYVHATLRRW